MFIRESTEKDLPDLLDVEKRAFGEDEGPEIVELINGLLGDLTARPLLSLVALNGKQVVGHILFTKARVSGHEEIKSAILAPLAVAPDLQNTGIGGRLIAEGLRILSESGVKLVFVLGHPDYYPRHGFRTAGVFGLEAPYPIPEEVAEAWMVQELRAGCVGSIKGKVLCAETLGKPEYWR